MKKLGKNMGIATEKENLIPMGASAGPFVPTSYRRFSTESAESSSSGTLHVGRIIELSRYQQP
jgi:hypothetical protein